MLAGVLNPFLITHIFDVHQVTPFGTGLYCIFYYIIIISGTVKFSKIFFCVTVGQLFYVLDIMIVSRNNFLNPTLVPIFNRINLLTLFSHLFSGLLNDPYFFKWNQLVVTRYVQNTLFQRHKVNKNIECPCKK